METVILVTFKITDLPIPIKIASAIEPNREQIYKKIEDLMITYEFSGEIQFKKLLKEKGNTMYIYEIGDRKCMVIVEKLEKIKEFEPI